MQHALPPQNGLFTRTYTHAAVPCGHNHQARHAAADPRASDETTPLGRPSEPCTQSCVPYIPGHMARACRRLQTRPKSTPQRATAHEPRQHNLPPLCGAFEPHPSQALVSQQYSPKASPCSSKIGQCTQAAAAPDPPSPWWPRRLTRQAHWNPVAFPGSLR